MVGDFYWNVSAVVCCVLGGRGGGVVLDLEDYKIASKGYTHVLLTSHKTFY